MSSVKSVFAVILVIFSGCHSKPSLNKRICNETSLTVDSIVMPFGTNFLYLFSGDMVFKIKPKYDGQAVIQSSQKLQDWDPKIKSTIDMVYTTKKNPKYISLINCEMKKEWIIRYGDNQYNGSIDLSPLCNEEIEYVIDSKTGVQYGLVYLPKSKELLVVHLSFNTQWYIRAIGSDIRALLPTDNLAGTTSFYQIKGSIIKAGFYFDDYWYLFGGRYYCRVRLGSWTQCKSKPISEWIENCKPEWNHVSESNSRPKNKNQDISLYIIIVVTIIAVALVAIIIIIMLTCKEYKKRGTYMKGSNNTSI